MGQPISRPVLAAAVEAAVLSVEGLPPGEKLDRAKAIVLNEPTIAQATEPVSRLKSETIQGIAAAGAAQLLQATGLVKTLVIAAGWFGQSWDADEVSTVLSSALTLIGLAYAWYGRETTTRPLA